MKVKIDKVHLSQATTRCQGAVSDKTMGQIAIKAESSQMMMTASDRILSVYNSIDSEILREGFVHVPARLFSDIVRELPDGPVILEKVRKSLVMTAGKQQEFVMKIPRLEVDEWRDVISIEAECFADLPAQHLCYLIDQVQCCVSYESARNYGSVAFFHRPKDDILRLVGTDGYRLSYAELMLSLPPNFLSNGVCLSKRALNELHRMASEGFETIRLAIADDQSVILAETPGYQIYIRLSSVKYPKYQGVVPSFAPTPVNISRQHFQSVAKRVLLASDKTKALHLCFDSNMLTLKSRTLGSSEGKESIPLSDYDSEALQLAVNGKFLTDVFSTISSPGVMMNFRSEDDPIVLRPRTEPDNCQSMHVLIPIREN